MVKEKKNICLLKQKPVTVEQKEEMVIQYAKLDLKIDAVFANEVLPTVPGAADGVDGGGVDGGSGLGGSVSEEERLLPGRYPPCRVGLEGSFGAAMRLEQ